MTHTFVIDSLPESAAQYRETHAMVVADVFRFGAGQRGYGHPQVAGRQHLQLSPDPAR